ncbi:MAG: methyltransferase domain-containing protein [Sedimentisphaerales bacterium]|nr:methyltransferase domain-containing protein [Sedimentisphaerales bacterium]
MAEVYMSRLKRLIYRFKNRHKTKYMCPLCGYRGPFSDVHQPNGPSSFDTTCPQCGSRARHRLMSLVMDLLSERYNFNEMKALHFAPEIFFRERYQNTFREYKTTDLAMENVDFNADICNLPFENNSYDVVLACHVLEHIKEDRKAMSEIHRICRPGGIVIIQVPITAMKTIEYPAPNPYETDHVRCPGQDYYDRFRDLFAKLETFSSKDFDDSYQLYAKVDWSGYPNEYSPYRLPLPGDRHVNIIAVYSV